MRYAGGGVTGPEEVLLVGECSGSWSLASLSGDHQMQCSETGTAINVPRFFVDWSGFLEAGYKQELGKRSGVVFSGFGSKSKEDEEDESANDARPLG